MGFRSMRREIEREKKRERERKLKPGINGFDQSEADRRVRRIWDECQHWMIFLGRDPRCVPLVERLTEHYGNAEPDDFTVLVDPRLVDYGVLVMARKALCEWSTLRDLLNSTSGVFIETLDNDDDEKDFLLIGNNLQTQNAAWWLEGIRKPGQWQAKAVTARWN